MVCPHRVLVLLYEIWNFRSHPSVSYRFSTTVLIELIVIQFLLLEFVPLQLVCVCFGYCKSNYKLGTWRYIDYLFEEWFKKK